ncbi:MAG: hypothetical protein PHQ43_09515 [Dehalococcoidales bacterium]|nr:hypothetical protein [Dehalococcoidales bacterium]
MISTLNAVICLAIGMVAAYRNDMSQVANSASNPFPGNRRAELEKKYGRWAVQIAIANCPLGNFERIEREAKRLSESRLYKRRK